MRDSIAAYKENLSRIANEFLDAADDELEASPHRGPSNGVDYPASSGRRTSRRFVRLSAEGSPNGSTIANGIDSGSQDEIAKYKADILKLQTSEAEIKALSFNYAAMLKDKEEELSKLREENFSLKNHLDVTNGHALRDESSSKISSASSNVVKGSVDRSSIRKQKSLSQENSHYMGNNMVNGSPSKQDSRHNGGLHKSQYDLMQQKLELKSANSAVIEKGYPDLLEENNKFVAAQTLLESNIKQLKAQLENERGNTATLKQKLQEEHQLNESSQRELHNLKLDKEQISVEMKELKKELKEKISEIGRLEAECRTSISQKESNHSLERLKDMVKTSEKENEKLKTEKEELVENLKHCRNNSSEKSSNLQEVTAEMRVSIRNLEDTLKHACKERDKALQELARLKQHLLEKELEDSDKMDEDSKMIEELRANCEHQRAHILQLEKSLKLEISKREDLKKLKSDELQRSNEIINDLRQKFATSMSLLDSRNVELLNLQTALGQYYAESEAKDRLGRDLALAREESAKLSESLKVANQEQEMGRRENKDLAAKLAQAERLLSEGKWSMQKLEEDNLKLRRALDQSMTRLNRMSLDSDNYVDRRIVIKLLVTYFQRNHSKEVLDLIVRMLGFSEEDKQRIGFAQTNASKGVVQGVLGLPGRLVGGILGVGSVNSSSLASDNQSFGDLWVDFLLKETEERERRELSEAAKLSSGAQEKSAISARLSTVPHNGATFSTVQLSTK